MAIEPALVIPAFMLTPDRKEDVIQFLHDMPIPDDDKIDAFTWYASHVAVSFTDEDRRRLIE